MPLISQSDVINIAFASNIDPVLIKDFSILYAEEKYILPILGNDLYNDVVANPGSYSVMINNYIMPCLAYYVKLVSLNTLMLETANFSALQDPDTLPELVAMNRGADISKHLREGLINDVFQQARFFARKLHRYVVDNYGIDQPFPEIDNSRRLSNTGFFTK